MKNLLIFVDPAKDFNAEHHVLAKIQVDWSLQMGWAAEDIWLVTNFPYQYKGVKAVQVDDDCYYPAYNRATKVPVIRRLGEMGLINDTFWFHDFDAFQLTDIPKPDADFAIVLYGKTGKRGTPDNKWNAGSFFFSSANVFRNIERTMWLQGMDEENALTYMMDCGFSDYKELDISYCLHIYNVDENVSKADKPIKVVHFHPSKERHRKLFNGIIPERLINIFRVHGIAA